MRLAFVPAEQGGFRFLPQGGMFIVEPFKYGLHQCFPEKFRFVGDTIPVAIDPQSPRLPFVEHYRKPAVPF